MKSAVLNVRSTAEKKAGVLARMFASALWAGTLAADAPAAAGPSCPEGMWASHGSCCELGDEYVPGKNQCLPVRPERRCVEGHLDDCVVAGRQLEQRGTIGAGYAAELYRYACDEGHAPACRGLGSLHERGLGLDRDEARGRELYEQACDGGDAPACTLLAERLIAEDSLSSPREQSVEARAGVRERNDKAGRALTLFAQACHRGDAQACGELGEQLARRPEQSKQSTGYFELACSGGVGASCRTLLQRERSAHEVAPGRARELLDRGCRAADAESCFQLGDGLRDGSLAPQSSAQAALRYRTACEAGHLLGCVRLAELTAQGEGVTRDLRRASELYARACGAGVKLACERASALAGK